MDKNYTINIGFSLQLLIALICLAFIDTQNKNAELELAKTYISNGYTKHCSSINKCKWVKDR